MYIKLRIESLSKPKIGTHFIQLSYWHQKHKNSQKTRITLSKSKKKNVPKFQNLDIVLVSCNLIERKYQQNSGEFSTHLHHAYCLRSTNTTTFKVYRFVFSLIIAF